MASGSVGGMSGAFIPVSEDAGMIAAVRAGALSLDKLEAWTSVCSVGIDMVAVPGSTSAETIAAIIADEMAVGVMNNKTTAVRIIPVPGLGVGEMVEFGGLLGSAPIMPVNIFSSAEFIRRGGRIPRGQHGGLSARRGAQARGRDRPGLRRARTVAGVLPQGKRA